MNYFNYYTEIEDAFVRRRGKHLFLSPMDWALMETWKEQGIPLHLILRGIERSFDSFESKPRKRSVKTLLYCQEEVEAQFAEWLESRVGANPPANPETDKADTSFSPEAVREYLKHSRVALSELARSQNNDSLSEALTRAVSILKEIENDLDAGAQLNTRRLEDSLTSLERMLNDALITAVPGDELSATQNELKKQLKDYRKQMEAEPYNQMFNNLLLKRLREKYQIPRLSLFYL